ncbi:MAG: hypothetical protein ACKN9F_04065 [Methylomonas sp.]
MAITLSYVGSLKGGKNQKCSLNRSPFSIASFYYFKNQLLKLLFDSDPRTNEKIKEVQRHTETRKLSSLAGFLLSKENQ